MCGIAGVFRLTGRPAADDVAAVLRMLDAQLHRGPDDWGLLLPEPVAALADVRALVTGRGQDHVCTYPGATTGPGVVLGNRRLSILDVSARGRMPMGSADGRRWITHNGEIYNFHELRTELERTGAPFRTGTDTEAILRGHAAWGDGVVPRLRGMFALALFEAGQEPRLLLVRDRLGIKPLYYYRERERFIFASEVRALLRSGLVPDLTDPEALVRFLQLGSVPAPRTTIKGVRSLPAGHCLTVDVNGVRLDAYWDLGAHAPSSRGPVPDRAAVIERTRALLEESVRLHLVADVPLGVFLSGGIDSSGLVALASRFRDTPVTTLSVAFDEPAYSEAAYARFVAERYRTDHREVVLRARDLCEGLPRIFGAMDEPTVDGVNTYFVSEAAKRAQIPVVLSGTGGDEVFWGYEHFRRINHLDRARRLFAAMPAGARRSLARVLGRVGGAAGRTGFERFEYMQRPSGDALYLVVRGLFGPRQIQDLLGVSEAELIAYGPALPAAADGPASEAADGLGRLEFSHYLQNQLLKDTDVMSMAHSVETRVPYLDHRLVEYVVGLPAAMKLAGLPRKALLLEALDGALPPAVWNRPKMGFTFPFAEWLAQQGEDLLAATLGRGLLQRQPVEDVWTGFRAGRLHWSRVWALVVATHFDAGRMRLAA